MNRGFFFTGMAEGSKARQGVFPALSSGALCLLTLLIIFGADTAPAGESTGDAAPGGMTLEEALAVALEKNKDILRAREYRKLVAGRYIEERSAALPQFHITSGISRSRDETQRAYGAGSSMERRVYSGSIGLNQVLFTFGKVGAAIRSAKIGMESAEEQLRMFRQLALRDVSVAFYDVLLATHLETLARENVEQKRRHHEEVQRKYRLGVATDFDVLAADVAVKNALPGVTRIENLIAASQEKLRFLLGMEDGKMHLRGSLERPIVPYPSVDAAVDVARARRPEIIDMKNRIGIAEELVTIARAQDKPRLDLKADVGWSDLNLDTGQSDGTVWTAGIYLTFPLFDGLRSRGKVLQAKSTVETLRIEEAALHDTILLQTREAVDDLREAGEIVQALSATVEQADRLLLMAEKGYEFGVKTKLDVDDAALHRMQILGDLARARRDYLVARVVLDWVMGTIGEVLR